MSNLARILTLLIVTVTVGAWSEPALGARLAQLQGEAGEKEVTDSADFKLSDQSAVEVNYDIEKLDEGCKVQIKIYREQNGRWLVVHNVLSTKNSIEGSRPLTLPPGRYRIKVSATHASYDVSVDN